MDYKDYLMEELQGITRSPMMRAENIPRVDLYMEQLLQFFDQEMGEVLLYADKDEKVFTKTMINNYTKEGALPRPINKKYGEIHMIMLAYISMLKRILSISEIRDFFNLVEDKEQLVTMYRAYTEMVDEYRGEYVRLVEERMERIDKKLATHHIQDDKYKAMTFISLMGLEAAVNQTVCGKLLEAYKEGKMENPEEPEKQQEEKPE